MILYWLKCVRKSATGLRGFTEAMRIVPKFSSSSITATRFCLRAELPVVTVSGYLQLIFLRCLKVFWFEGTMFFYPMLRSFFSIQFLPILKTS